MKELSLGKELVSEFMGTLVLILFGTGTVAMTVLFGEALNITWANITLGWGLAVLLGVMAGLPSGAHINPAVTLGLAVTGRFPWRKVVPFTLAQTAGAFVGAALVFIDFKAKWLLVDPNLASTAGIFCTFPAIPDSFMPGFIDQIIGTAILLFGILAAGDFAAKNNAGWSVVALLVTVIGMALGAMNGYAINPARDFGPRLFALVAGFTQANLMDISIVLTPIIGPFIGGAVGAVVYDWTTGAVHKAQN
jgi:glycerol uptake facilitator protein